MLTILAWLIFIPSFAVNVTMAILMLKDFANDDFKFTKTDPYEIGASLTVMFISGVYLFGLF
jgi:hypothetical protein